MRLEDLQGHRLGRYEIIGLLGRGGMAAVYRAHDTALRRDVALKILYPQYAGDTALVERFQREAVLAANLDHPNILPIYDVGEADGLVYIAMRLLNGPSFADTLRLRGSLPPAELIPIIDQIASALDYAHARQIVHRDIKPANILIEESGSGSWGSAISPANTQLPTANSRAMLTDFGIAKSLDPLTTGLTVTGVLIGTPEYMAPEQIHGRGAIDGRADVYALGVLVYRALTGRRPFEGGTQEVLLGHLQGNAPAPSSIDPALPIAIDAVLRKALAREPGQRYSSAGEFARALRAAAGLGLDTPPPAMRRETDGRAVVPRIAINDMTRTNSADQVTRKGTIQPPGARATQPEQRRPARVAQPPSARSSGGVAWAILGLLLALVIGGGLAWAAGLIGGNRNNSGLIATVIVTETLAPTADSTVAPTADTTAADATAAPSPAPTEMPTAGAATAVPPPTQAPSARPSARPTVRPTARPTAAATSTSTPTASATPAPSSTPSPSSTPTSTPTLTATPEVKGGFKLLLDTDEGLRLHLGDPLKPEEGGPGMATEQQFEEGSMFYFKPEERIYVLVGRDLGTWRSFEQKDLLKLPTPPPNNCPAPQQGGFALIWGNDPKIQQRLGCSISPEPNLFEGALQPFQNGTLLYSQQGLGRGKTIYVVWEDGTFNRYDDLNP